MIDSYGIGSCLHFTAAKGTSYAIQVYGYGGATGNIVLLLSTARTPTNDDYARSVLRAMQRIASVTVKSGPVPTSESSPTGTVRTFRTGTGTYTGQSLARSSYLLVLYRTFTVTVTFHREEQYGA